MSWCEAEEPCGVSPARHGKCRGTRQLKPPAEQIIHPNPVTFAYLIVLFTWLAYHLVERVCSAGKKEFCLLWLFLWSICAHSLPAALWVWTVPRQQLQTAAFWEVHGRLGRPLHFQGVSGLRVNFCLAWSLSVTAYGCFRQHKVVFQDLPSGYGLCPCTVSSWEPRAACSSFFFCKGAFKMWCLIISRV